MIFNEAMVSFFSSRSEETKIARSLEEAFDITYGHDAERLSYWFAQPKAFIKERFGLQQEVLVVFSPNIQTNLRILPVIEQVLNNPKYRGRLDKVFSLVIYKEESDNLLTLLKAQADRIIVPLATTELLNPNKGDIFLRAKISEVLGTFDLFGMSSPIRIDKYFFGRDDLVQNMVTQTVNRRENSGLFGLRKTGKTSVLLAFQRRLQDTSILCSHIDCQNPGIYSGRWWQTLESIVLKLRDTLQEKKTFSGSLYASKTWQYEARNAGTYFTSDIYTLLNRNNLEQIILMLDEIEYITSGLSAKLGKHWDEDFLPFWQTIRAIHQESQGRFSFIVAGVNPTCVIKSHFGTEPNPIFQLVTPQFLEPLSSSALRDMVRSIGRYSGIKFDDSVYSYLHKNYGGHPYLTRIACSEVWRVTDKSNPEKLSTVVINNFNQQRVEIRARLAQPIRDILLSLVWWYQEEYDLLLIMAEGDADFVNDYLKQHEDSVLQFVRYGILRQDSNDFAIADLKEFLNTQGNVYKKELSPFTRGDIPPELLPEIPDLEVVGNLFMKRSEVEVRLRRAIYIYIGVQHGWDNKKIAESLSKSLPRRSDRPDPKEMFVGREPKDVMNELYIPDLKAIVINNWETMGVLFGGNQGRFEMNMDTINLARRTDAHTKPITNKERVDFENSYTWFSRNFEKLPNNL